MTKTPIYIDALPKSIKTARAALFSNGGKTMTKVVLPIVAVVYGMVIALCCMAQRVGTIEQPVAKPVEQAQVATRTLSQTSAVEVKGSVLTAKQTALVERTAQVAGDRLLQQAQVSTNEVVTMREFPLMFERKKTYKLNPLPKKELKK